MFFIQSSDPFWRIFPKIPRVVFGCQFAIQPDALLLEKVSVFSVYCIRFHIFIFLFSVEKIFSKGKYWIKQSAFFSLKLPMTRRVKGCRIVGVLYNTCVSSHRGSKAVGGWFISRYRPCFYTSFQISVDTFLFFNSKILGFFGKWTFFSEITPFPT